MAEDGVEDAESVTEGGEDEESKLFAKYTAVIVAL